MRRFLAIAGATALTIVAIVVVFYGSIFYWGHQLGIEGLPFVDEAVPAITKSWSSQELLDRASPGFLTVSTPEALGVLFQGLAVQLGALVEYGGATIGGTNYQKNFGSPDTFVGSYTAKARYRNGAASFQIEVTKRDGRWMINYFHVNTVPGPRVEEHI